MTVKEVMQKHPEAKIASEVVLEQKIQKLEDKLEMMMKILENMASRLDYLESRQ